MLENEETSTGEEKLDFSFEELDQLSGESDDISEDVINEMLGVEKKEVVKKDQPKKESKDLTTDEMVKQLAKNPKQFDQETEEKFADDLDSEDEADNDQLETESKSSEELESIMYNGEEKKLSKEELKELAQKGFDYTQKTQD